MPRHRLLLRGATVVTMNPGREVLAGDVLVEDDRIVDVAPKIRATRVDELRLLPDTLLIPGLVQPHIHLCQTLFRGRADGLELLDWLRERIWPFEAAHTPESLYVSAMLGGVELLRSGTTAILDMATVRHTEAVFQAAKKLGIRATIGKALMDKGQGVPRNLKDTTQDALAESLALAERWHGAENGRLRYAFAPRFVLSCTEELMRAVAREARARGLGIHTHASENAGEIEAVREASGLDNVSFLRELGCVGHDTVLAHCVWLTSEEQKILRETGTHVAHCPSSNLKLASGVAKIPELLAMGINVGIAADGAPCINTLDGFLELRLAALIQGPRSGPGALSSEKAFELATLGGARALGLADQIGSIEVGKKADLVAIDLRAAHLTPMADVYSTLVYGVRGSDVANVWVDGVERVRNGRVRGVKLPSLRAEAERHASRIAAETARV